MVEVVDKPDLSELVKAYRGSGSASHHSAMLQGPLMYGCATKGLSSQAIERAMQDSVTFRFIVGSEQPDHDTMACIFPVQHFSPFGVVAFSECELRNSQPTTHNRMPNQKINPEK